MITHNTFMYALSVYVPQKKISLAAGATRTTDTYPVSAQQ